MPGRIERNPTPVTPVVGREARTPAAPVARNTVRTDGFDVREGGPGQVTLTPAGELLLNGRKGSGAVAELARLIESGLSPFSKATDAQREKLVASLSSELGVRGSQRKPSTQTLLHRSAAATVLLSVARGSKASTREKAVSAYVDAMARETSPGFKTSLLVNLQASRVAIPRSHASTVERIREQILPSRPPYAEWFKGNKRTLNVRHYVMEEFWKTEVSAYKKRGFSVVETGDKKMVFEKVLKDPKGVEKDITTRVILRQEDTNVLRDLDDPDVQLIVYSGHSQYGGVMDAALMAAPKQMKGDKLIQLYNCRGKQNVGDLLTRYPGLHATGTYSSAYASDDVAVLTQTFDMIATRGDYRDIYKGLRSTEMIQPETNYILPDDPRLLSTRDSDHDGIRDVTATGPDWLFDPGKARATGGLLDFTPRTSRVDPQTLSGAKIDHAIAYANTSFFYFAEANRSAPITAGESDKFVSNGWFKGSVNDPAVRIAQTQRDGQTFYKVSINTAYSGQSREALSAMVIMELQQHLCLEDTGRYTNDDKLRGLLLVSGYVDLLCETREQCDAVLEGTAKKYGFEGVSYEVLYAASLKDGDHGVSSKAAVDYLKAHGVKVIN